MTTKEAARRIYETFDRALATGNLDLIDEVISADATDHSPDPGQETDLAGIKRAFDGFRQAFANLRFTVEDLIAEGDKVAVRLTTTGRHTGEFMGIPATGKDVSMTGIDLLRLRDGKVVDRWGAFDNLGLLQQLKG